MHPLDCIVIVAYLAIVPVLALGLSRRSGDLFHAREGLPAWAICFSLVATETSTLTFISVPGIGYVDGLVFVGLACGYLLGRIAVAVWFLPRYAENRLEGAYQLLGARFGPAVQRIAAGAFLCTRLLAESVRLAAGLLPLVWLAAQAHLGVGPVVLLLVIMGLTLLYTMWGGLRAVVWSDTIQLGLYLIGAGLCVWLLWPTGGLAAAQGRFALFHAWHWASASADSFTVPAAVVGGAILILASHGTDQLMVQRVLAARSLRAAQGALIASAFVVAALFALLSMIGIQLWLRNGGASFRAMGLSGPDQIFPHFIATGLPPGLGGLLAAGTLAAAMGSLSSALNTMASATLGDFGAVPRKLVARGLSALSLPANDRAVARCAMLVWSVALGGCTLLFRQSDRSAVVIGLNIAGWSYGPTLGIFLLALLSRTLSARAAIAGFAGGLVVMGGLLLALSFGTIHVAFAWLVPLGVVVSLLMAMLVQRAL